ncbi:MAG: TusE/DsrC/DsvC family sulfur relay protein [Thermodesulfovibrionales bacterium]
MAATIEAHGKGIELDEDGYLQNIDSWNINVAEYLAGIEGIELTAEHWRLITAIRLYYERNGASPLCGDILRETGFTKKDLYRIFPSSGYRTACKLAGLPKPPEC